MTTAHRLAKACLLGQPHVAAYLQDRHALSLDDLAMDCIGDVFARDAHGRFPELRAFFGTSDGPDGTSDGPDGTSDGPDGGPLDRATALRMLRQLVSRATSDRVFANCQSADPSLGRLIRNLKRTARTDPAYALATHNGTRWIAPADAAPLHDVRVLPLDVLAAHLAPHASDTTTTPQWVAHAFATLRARPDADAAYPVTQLAYAIRSALARVLSPSVAVRGQTTAPQSLLPQVAGLRDDEMRTVLRYSVRTTRTAKQAVYLERQALPPSLYRAYFKGIQTYLAAHYIPPGQPSLTHHGALGQHLDGLVRATYRARHRNRFEYLLRCTREAFLENVRCLVRAAASEAGTSDVGTSGLAPEANVTKSRHRQQGSSGGRTL